MASTTKKESCEEGESSTKMSKRSVGEREIRSLLSGWGEGRMIS